MTVYVRLALTEPEFDRLLEIVTSARLGADDPVVYKLRAKKLSHEGRQIAKGRTPKQVSRKVAS